MRGDEGAWTSFNEWNVLKSANGLKLSVPAEQGRIAVGNPGDTAAKTGEVNEGAEVPGPARAQK
jgi:hypothetical protein